jgi:acetyltransferase-like isoleucine patch superfamily enzyme
VIANELRYQLLVGLPIWFVSLSTMFFPDVGPLIRLRGLGISLFLPGRPRGLRIGRDVSLLCADRLRLGANVYIAKGSWINAIGGVTLCDEVTLGPYVVMSSTNHGFRDGSAFKGGAHPAPIVIGRGSWVAAHAVVTAGVEVGAGVIVGANSVVTRSTADNVIMGGVPAKVLSGRSDNPSNVVSKHGL